MTYQPSSKFASSKEHLGFVGISTVLRYRRTRLTAQHQTDLRKKKKKNVSHQEASKKRDTTNHSGVKGIRADDRVDRKRGRRQNDDAPKELQAHGQPCLKECDQFLPKSKTTAGENSVQRLQLMLGK